MFRTLASLIDTPADPQPNLIGANDIFLIHPTQLSRWLEQAWAWGTTGQIQWQGLGLPKPFLNSTTIIPALALPETLVSNDMRSGISNANNPFPVPPLFGAPPPPGLLTTPPWDHLIYALLIENTGVVEIFTEVLRRYLVGETLEMPSIPAEQWLRCTEELFFRDPPLFHINGIVSSLRPDLRISRRNAYWRMFGMDLAHPLPPSYGGGPGGLAPWKRDVGVANNRFREVWLEFLREAWIGIENVSNSSGAKPTDPGFIAELARLLSDMLGMRRQNGQLAREEFTHVSWMSWFHMTVEYDTPIVVDLKSQGEDPADRLMKIGQRVGIAAPPHAREYFELADIMSTAIRFVELGAFNDPTQAALLFDTTQQVGKDMNRIIDLWQLATGDRVKDQPVRAPAARPAGPPTVGRVPVGTGLASVGRRVPAGTNGTRRS